MSDLRIFVCSDPKALSISFLQRGFKTRSSLLSFLLSNPTAYNETSAPPPSVTIASTRFSRCILLCGVNTTASIRDNNVIEDSLLVATSEGKAMRVEGNGELRGVLAWDATIRFNATVGAPPSADGETKSSPSSVAVSVGSESDGSRTLHVDHFESRDLKIPQMFEELMSIKHDKLLQVPSGSKVRDIIFVN